jgi:hypothetical protein
VIGEAVERIRRLPPVGKAAVVGVTAWNVSLMVLAQRDLHRRADDEIRGSRRLWQFACLTNTVGPLSYFRWGRA